MIWIALVLVVNVLVVLLFLWMRKSAPCPVDVDMHGKIVVITGGNSGIGLEAAKELARRRAHVIIACRNKERGEEAVLEIIRETKWSNVRSVKLDLTSFKSVRECANNLLQSEDRIDALINNAAGFPPQGSEILLTEDGIEYQYQANFYGHFLLTSLLLPALLKSSQPRLVNVSSCLYKLGKIDLSNYNHSKYRERGMQVYSNTKLAIVMTTRELAARFGDRGLGAFSCTPGTCNTNIARNVPWYIRSTLGQVSKFFSRSAEDGAQTLVYLAVDPALSKSPHNGKYFVDCEVEPLLASALDEGISAKLFAFSERLTGADYSII